MELATIKVQGKFEIKISQSQSEVSRSWGHERRGHKREARGGADVSGGYDAAVTKNHSATWEWV